MRENVSDGDGPGRIPHLGNACLPACPILFYNIENISLVSRERANGEMNEDTGRNEESASQHRRPCVPLGDLLT